ncbi:MAG: TlpA disulfide reductase family protein [Planctomycetia bacterium]|nr:TlpA disulfide reductase family protein [Planctomycetia bacterium]
MKKVWFLFCLGCCVSVLAQDVEESVLPDVKEGRAPKQIEVSPFEKGNLVSSQRERTTKNLWADSWLFLQAPRLDDAGKILPETDATGELPAAERLAAFLKVEEWYHQAPPALEGKYVLIEFWATWCPPCRRTLSMLNGWKEKFGDELVVISVCEADRKAIDDCPGKLKGKDLTHFVGIDTQRRMANALGVFGIPHAVLIEPQYGAVVWEGMPNQPKFELTDEIIEKILSVGRKVKGRK